MTEDDAKKISDQLDESKPISMWEYINVLVDYFPNDSELGENVRDFVLSLRN